MGTTKTSLAAVALLAGCAHPAVRPVAPRPAPTHDAAPTDTGPAQSTADAAVATADAAVAPAPLALAPGATGLLAGRLQITLPRAAEEVARDVDIMAAPNSSAEETRVILDADDERLVVFATERFGTTDDLAATARDLATRLVTAGATSEAVDLGDGGRALLFAAHRPRATSEATPVSELVARAPDRTVMTVIVYVNPDALRSDCAGLARRAARPAGGGCVALGQAFLRGVRTGPRATLDLSPGPRRIFVDAAPTPVEVTLPAGWVTVAQPGPDFDLAWIRSVPDGREEPASLGIYLGHHPSPHRGDRALPGVPGRLFGEAMTWDVWHVDASDEGPARTRMEFLRNFPGHPGLVVHVFFSAEDARRLDASRSVAETLRTR